MNSAIDALYCFDHNNEPIFEHVYRSRPASAQVVLPLYLAHPVPRPSLIYLPSVNPPTILLSISRAGLLFLVPSTSEVDPLFVLEFVLRFCDVLEDFLGGPLLASKIRGSYDVVAQLLGEMCDAGNVCNTESNALREVVEIPGWMDKLLGGVGLPGSSPALAPPGGLRQQLSVAPASSGPAIPWRRPNVRHTSNELYVDIVETLAVTLAPSGRLLAAFANGSILFTAKISGVPDLVLNLLVPSGRHTINRVMEMPTFHPCVRLNTWKERPGELSFVPPDGKFVLAGYEVNLIPGDDPLSQTARTLNLPAIIEVDTSLGPVGLEFEVRLIISTLFALNAASGQSRPLPGGRGSGRSTPSFFGGVSAPSPPSLRDVVVTIPVPLAVRNITDLRSSRGEASFQPLEHQVVWKIPTKETADAGTASLRCAVVGPIEDEAEDEDAEGQPNGPTLGRAYEEYDETQHGYQAQATVGRAVLKAPRGNNKDGRSEERDMRKVDQNLVLMPTSAAVSFSVKGWLASGIKVESLNVDLKRSRGLGEGVKPVKGVKYLTISKKGIETRC